MAFFQTQFSSFGLDISDGSIKTVQITKSIKGPVLKSWGSREIDRELVVNGIIQDPSKLAKEIKTLVKQTHGEINTKYVVSALPESKTYIKLLELNTKQPNKNEIQNFIDSELTNHVPIEKENLSYDFQTYPNSNKKNYCEILIGAAPKDLVDQYTKTLELAELKPIALEIEAQSILRAITEIPSLKNKLATPKNITKNNQTENNPRIVLDLGANRSSLIFLDEYSVKFTSSLTISGNAVTKNISEKLNISWEKAEKAKKICGLDPKKGKGEIYKITEKTIQILTQEIQKSIDHYLNQTTNDKKNIELILVGGASALRYLKEHIAKNLNIKVSNGDPLINIPNRKNNILSKDVPGMTTVLGLALRHLTVEDL